MILLRAYILVVGAIVGFLLVENRKRKNKAPNVSVLIIALLWPIGIFTQSQGVYNAVVKKLAEEERNEELS